MFKVYQIKAVSPVNNVIRVNQYRREEREEHEGEKFSQVLEKAKQKKRESQPVKKEEKLRVMGGLNRYNNKAMEVFFLLYNEMDCKA